jgi:hypothetical protein
MFIGPVFSYCFFLFMQEIFSTLLCTCKGKSKTEKHKEELLLTWII